MLRDDQPLLLEGIINQKIEYKNYASPIIIKNAQFIDLKGCASITTSSTINVSHSLFSASYIDVSILIRSTSNVIFDMTCIGSCMSLTSPSPSGEVLYIETTQSLSVNYGSLTSCITTLSFPNGYVDRLQGSIVEFKNHNTSYCYGTSNPGDYLRASDLTYKHCYSGHTKCGVAAIEHLLIDLRCQIKEFVVESVQALDDQVIGYYDCSGKIPVTIEDCTFWNLAVSHVLYTSGKPLTAIGCAFQSSSPATGGQVTLSPDLNHFSIQALKVEKINCYEQLITQRDNKLRMPLVLWLMKRLGVFNIFL